MLEKNRGGGGYCCFINKKVIIVVVIGLYDKWEIKIFFFKS